MAKKKTESVLVQAAERVGRSLGRGVRRLDTVKAAARKLVSGTGRKKTAKKAAKKRAKTAVTAAEAVKKPAKKAASTPASTRRSRALTTMAAMKGQLGTMVDERARARATSGERWSARKPR